MTEIAPKTPLAPLPVHPETFRPETASEGDAPGTRFLCGLCGCRFTHGGQVCGSCPMSTGCDLVRCPNCGYQFPRSSHIVDAVRRLWRILRRTP